MYLLWFHFFLGLNFIFLDLDMVLYFNDFKTKDN